MRLYRIVYQSILSLLLVSCTFATYAQEEATNPFYYYEQAMQAYGAKNYPLYEANLSKVVGPQTRQPALLYQMAGAYSLNGNTKDAFTLLNKLADMGLTYPVSTDADFENFRKSAQFAQIRSMFEKNSFSKHPSKQAFVIKEKDLVPEGITYDVKENQWLVGSIY